MRMAGQPCRREQALELLATLRSSSGVPTGVVNTNPWSCQSAPAASRASKLPHTMGSAGPATVNAGSARVRLLGSTSAPRVGHPSLRLELRAVSCRSASQQEAPLVARLRLLAPSEPRPFGQQGRRAEVSPPLRCSC